MTGYQPGEQPANRTLVKLNTNENPYPPSPWVQAAVERAANDDLNRYPSPMTDRLRELAADRYRVSPEQVLVGNGSDELLAMCLKACAGEGARVAYATPTYSLYRTLVDIACAQACEVIDDGLDERDRPEVWRGLADHDAAVTFVCNPNSPFGTAVAPSRIGDLAARVNGLVVADEAYVDFGGRSALDLISRHANLLVVRTLSKSFSLAGVRIGLAFGDRQLIGEIAKVKDSYNVSRLAAAAGSAALEDYDWMARNVERIVATRHRVVAVVRQAGYRVPQSVANFFWMDCSPGSGKAVYEHLRANGVLVRYFDVPALRAGVRVTVGTDPEMDRFLVALPPCPPAPR